MFASAAILQMAFHEQFTVQMQWPPQTNLEIQLHSVFITDITNCCHTIYLLAAMMTLKIFGGL